MKIKVNWFNKENRWQTSTTPWSEEVRGEIWPMWLVPFLRRMINYFEPFHNK